MEYINNHFKLAITWARSLELPMINCINMKGHPDAPTILVRLIEKKTSFNFRYDANMGQLFSTLQRDYV